MSSRQQASQTNLFYARLDRMLNPDHHLYQLTQKIDWELFDIKFHDYPQKVTWPTAPIRSLSGLIMLKQIYHLQDEWVLKRWEENPYFQFFTGESEFQWHTPVPIQDFIHFQQWVGEDGIQEIREHIKPFLNKSGQKGENLKLDF